MIETTTCKAYGNITIPADKQRGFCARQYRLGKENCVACDRGKEAAQSETTEIRADIYEKPLIGSTREKREEHMAKKCTRDGCKKWAVKDDLCTRHYREKHGEAPFPKDSKKAPRFAKAPSKPRGNVEASPSRPSTSSPSSSCS